MFEVSRARFRGIGRIEFLCYFDSFLFRILVNVDLALSTN